MAVHHLPAVAKKQFTIQVRGEKTFTLLFTHTEIRAIVLAHFQDVYDEEIRSMSLTAEWNNDGSLSIQGWQEIKEG